MIQFYNDAVNKSRQLVECFYTNSLFIAGEVRNTLLKSLLVSNDRNENKCRCVR